MRRRRKAQIAALRARGASSGPSGDIIDQLFTTSNGAAWVAGTRGVNAFANSSDPSTTSVVRTSWSGTETNPNGNTADELVEDGTATTSHFAVLGGTEVGGGRPYVSATVARAVGTRNFAIRLNLQVAANKDAIFDLGAGTVTSVDSGASATMTAVGSGYYRCTVMLDTVDQLDNNQTFFMVDGSSLTFSGDSTSSLWVSELQSGVASSAAVPDYEETTGDALAGAMLDLIGSRHMLKPGGTADPVDLDHDGTDYVWFPGTLGNRLTVPDSAALDVTGDFELRLDLDLDWSQSGEPLFSKWVTGGQESIRLDLNSTGFVFYTSEDGTVNVTTNTGAHGLTTDRRWQVKIEFDVDNGSSQREVTVYKRDPALGLALDSDTSWTQVANNAVAGATTIFSSTSDVEIFSTSNNSNTTLGKMHRVIFKDGIDGTTVLDVNASDADPNSTTFTEASSNAATVTINRSGTGYKTAVVDQPKAALATDDYFTANDDALFDFTGSTDEFTVGLVFADHHGANNGRFMEKRNTTVGFALYQSPAGEARMFVQGTSGNTQTANLDFTETTLAAVAGVQTGGEVFAYADGAFGPGVTVTATGSYANGEPLTINGTGLHMDCEVVGGWVIKQALTAQQISDVADALITRNGGTP